MFVIKRSRTLSCIGSLILITLVLIENGLSYVIPEPTFEILEPKGFRVSIPDIHGTALFAFHGAINHPIEGVQTGDFFNEVLTATNGKWVYENDKINLKLGDILYYWIHVQHGNQGYRMLGKSFSVSTVGGITIKTDKAPDNVDASNACVKSMTTIRGGQSVCRGELIFEDNFDVLNWTKWRREVRIPLDVDDAEFVSFEDRPGNLYIISGELYIVPKLLSEVSGYDEDKIRNGKLDLGQRCTGIFDMEKECKRCAGLFRILPPVASARIRTKESFSFRYGRIEVRAKLCKGDWIFPQIMLEPQTNEYGITGYGSGQMRVAFIRSNDALTTHDGILLSGQRLSGGVVLKTGEKDRDTWLKYIQQPKHWGDDYHTYSLTWTDTSIQVAVDGNTYGTINGGFRPNENNASIMAPFDQEFHIAIGVSVGGISDFPNDSLSGTNPKPWDNTDPKAELKFWNDRTNWHRTWNYEDSSLIVDYVRVWAL